MPIAPSTKKAMAFVTAAAALEHYWSDSKFQASIEKRAQTITLFLDKLVQSYPSAAFTRRGRGMMQGLAFNDPVLANRVTELSFQNGLIIETSGGRDEVIKLLTPLTIEPEKLLAGLDILEQAVADTVGEMNSQPSKNKEVNA